jgi:hypothetical protein
MNSPGAFQIFLQYARSNKRNDLRLENLLALSRKNSRDAKLASTDFLWREGRPPPPVPPHCSLVV